VADAVGGRMGPLLGAVSITFVKKSVLNHFEKKFENTLIFRQSVVHD
jgi:hypothetical protein